MSFILIFTSPRINIVGINFLDASKSLLIRSFLPPDDDDDDDEEFLLCVFKPI